MERSRTKPPGKQGSRTRPARSAALGVLAWALLTGAVARSVWLAYDSGIDLDVYRLGGSAVADRHGADGGLYDVELSVHDGGELLFTYPPFAALLFVPLAHLPEPLTELALALASMGIAAALAAVLLRYAHARGRPLPLQDRLGPATAVAAGTAVLLWSGPWMRTVGLGQINALLLALVLYDLLRTRGTGLPGRIPRGSWIGLAAGIKLTPLAFGLVFLVRRQPRPVLTLGSVFAATVLVGFLVLPGDAVRFWTEAVVDGERVGSPAYIDNTSLQGVLLHLGVPGGVEPALRWALVLAMVVGAGLLMRVLAARGMTLSVVAVNALVMLFMSPVTWSHHHVWWGVVAVAGWVEAWPGLLREELPAAGRALVVVLGAVALAGLYVGPIRWDAWLTPAGVPAPALDVVATLPHLALFLLLALWAAAGLRAGTRGASGPDRG